MTGTFDLSAYQRKVEEEAGRALGQARTPKEFLQAMQRICAMAEQALEDNMDAAERQHIACAAGCGTCCVVNVAVLFPEAAAILAYVGEQMSNRERESFGAKLEELYRRILWLDDEERVVLRQPCAFLSDEGFCSIYPVRPLICRSMTSTDPEDCREAIAFKSLGEEKTVLVNLFQKTLMDATFRAVGAGLQKNNLDGRSLKLTVAMKSLMENPQMLEQFLDGAPVPAG